MSPPDTPDASPDMPDAAPDVSASAASPRDAGPADAPHKGMSTGAKILFGCLGLTFLGIVVMGVLFTVGGVVLKRGVDSAVGTLEEQREAGVLLRRIEEEHPFEPSSDGVVGEERLQRFLAVTERAWPEIQPWAEDLEALRERSDASQGGLATLRDMAGGARALGGLAGSRVALAEALDAHGMSLGEYVWTGMQLSRAVEAAEGRRAAESVPPANLELARRHAGRLPHLDGGDDTPANAVLSVGILWGMADLSSWRALGLDTLARASPAR